MTTLLTEEQARALSADPNAPLWLVDPFTNRPYVLLSKDMYDRVKAIVEVEPREVYPAIDKTFAEGWNHPGMDEYDRYEEFRQ